MFEALRSDPPSEMLRAAFPPVRGGDAAFVPLIARLRAVNAPAAANASQPAPVVDPAEIERAAFAAGVAQGHREAEAALAEERAALATLAHSLSVLQPEPSRELALLLAETVDRLVRQAIGEVAVDQALLAERATDVAQLIAEASVPGRMRMHPDDVLRMAEVALPVELVADAGLAPGSVLLETNDGWIEAGPDVALEKLGTLLDRLGAPR